MIAAIVYSILGLLLLVGVAVFIRSSRQRPEELEERRELDGSVWDTEGLSVAERIFDPRDYCWLRDHAGFPRLAESLRRSRQRMALEWLGAVRRSFDDLLKASESPDTDAAGSPVNWNLLRQALRFHFVVGYAYFVVRFFGPYHSLVPSCRWMRPETSGRFGHERLGPAHSSRLF